MDVELADRIARSRALKAHAIAAICPDHEVDAKVAVHLDETGRRSLARLAGVRDASPKTWRIVVEMLAQSARMRARCVTCGMGDPEGTVGPPKPTNHKGPCSR